MAKTNTTTIGGLTYKIGVHGKAFYQSDGEWRLSARNNDKAFMKILTGNQPKKTKKQAVAA